MAMNRASFAKMLEPGLNTLFGLEYDSYPAEYEAVFESNTSQKAFEEDDSRPVSRLETARQLGETSIAFLIHPTIDEVTMTSIAKAAEAVFRQAARNA